MFDHDDEIIRRPLLVTFAAIIWYVASGLFALVFINVAYGFTFSFVWGCVVCLLGLFVFFGLLCFPTRYRLYTGKFDSVMGVIIASFVTSAIFFMRGIGRIHQYFHPDPLSYFAPPHVAWSIAELSVGNMFFLAGVFLLVSRKKYVIWSKSRRIAPPVDSVS